MYVALSDRKPGLHLSGPDLSSLRAGVYQRKEQLPVDVHLSALWLKTDHLKATPANNVMMSVRETVTWSLQKCVRVIKR